MPLDCHIVMMDWADDSKVFAYEISRFGPDRIDCRWFFGEPRFPSIYPLRSAT
jgi:hypothetical protein